MGNMLVSRRSFLLSRFRILLGPRQELGLAGAASEEDRRCAAIGRGASGGAHFGPDWGIAAARRN
jgi:hypothetical protein